MGATSICSVTCFRIICMYAQLMYNLINIVLWSWKCVHPEKKKKMHSKEFLVCIFRVLLNVKTVKFYPISWTSNYVLNMTNWIFFFYCIIKHARWPHIKRYITLTNCFFSFCETGIYLDSKYSGEYKLFQCKIKYLHFKIGQSLKIRF